MEKYFKTISFISAILLLIATRSLPYGYYQFLRFFIFFSGSMLVHKFHKLNNISLSIIFGVIALLFNPVMPMYLKKETWVLIDIVSSILFFYSINMLKKRKK